MPGIVDIEAQMEHDLPEYRLIVDRERAAATGLGSGALASTLGVLVGGQAVSTYEDQDGEAVDVRVRLPKELRGDVQQVGDLKMTVPTPAGPALVPLTDLVTFTRATSPAEIGRRDLKRQVSVDANLDNVPARHGQHPRAGGGVTGDAGAGLRGRAGRRHGDDVRVVRLPR